MTSTHAVTTEPATHTVEVRVAGQVVARSKRAVQLHETGLPDRWYLPVEDVHMELLEPTQTTSTCPYKGHASYWSVRIGDQTYHDVVWSYADPIPSAQQIAGLLAFWDGKPGIEVRVGPGSQ